MTITALKITLKTFIAVVRTENVQGALVVGAAACPLCRSQVRVEAVHACSRGVEDNRR